MSVSTRRAVITGLGLISPLGNTAQAFWEALVQGRSGVAKIGSFRTDYMPTSFAAEAREFSGAIDDFGPLEGEKKKAIRKGLKVMCRESQMGVAAAQRALSDAKITDGSFDPDLAGVLFGSDYMMTMPEDFTSGIRRCIGPDGKFDFNRWALEGMPQLTPLWLLKYLPNMPASHVAIYNDMRGPNNSITLREASANLAVGEAFRTIQRGHAALMVAGATGTRVHPMKMVHVVSQEEVAGNGAEPTRASRPFDLKRTGMVLGEGAGAIVLEELVSAQARGARIYGEIIGTSSSSVADRQRVAHRRQALVNAMRGAMRDAGLGPKDIGHIHAHGLSTRSSDVEEASAIREIFGDVQVPITAAKSYFGNLGAGSGLVELIASLLAMEHGELFPVQNYETPDPECPLKIVTTKGVSPGATFLNINVTPQGQAAAVVVRKFG
jgi:3-oxoacyl-[acyl-carrier-protein] synthase II